jgi:hypothetical protein
VPIAGKETGNLGFIPFYQYTKRILAISRVFYAVFSPGISVKRTVTM